MVGSDAAPAASPRKRRLGRPRDPARAALRPLCEELAGLGLAQTVAKAAASSQEARTRGLVSGGEPLKNAAMERRPARVLDRKRARRRKAAIQDEALSGAPSPSAMPGGRREKSANPAPQRTGAMTHVLSSLRGPRGEAEAGRSNPVKPTSKVAGLLRSARNDAWPSNPLVHHIHAAYCLLPLAKELECVLKAPTITSRPMISRSRSMRRSRWSARC